MVPGSAPVALAATMNNWPTRCSRLSAANCCDAVSAGVPEAGGAGLPLGTTSGEAEAVPGPCVAAGGEDVGAGAGLDCETGGVDDSGAPALEHPVATTAVMAMAMTVLLTAMTVLLDETKDWVLRMVNRGFVGVGFPLRHYPR